MKVSKESGEDDVNIESFNMEEIEDIKMKN